MAGVSDIASLPMMKMITQSAAETRQLGVKLGKQLRPNAVIGFFGDLGAGKTTFIQGLAEGVLGTADAIVNSPTFTYLNIYKGDKTLYHFDLYRLRDVDEFLSMGFDEMFDAGGICCVEWAEKIEKVLPEDAVRISAAHLGGDKRMFSITHKGVYDQIQF